MNKYELPGPRLRRFEAARTSGAGLIAPAK